MKLECANSSTSSKDRILKISGLVVLLAALMALAACSKGDATKSSGPPPSVPVVVASAGQQDIPVMITAIGTVQPFTTVQVKSMVAAQIDKVHFTQGQDLKKGQLLFTLDKRSFEADLQKAIGAMAKDKASAENAAVEAKRYAALLKEGVVAQQQYDQMQSQAAQMAAAVESDQAAVQSAKVNLQYTNIYSPVDGRAGDVLVHEGNLVKANDVPLVVINQITPIYAEFNIPEQQLPDVKQYMARGSLVVDAGLPNVQGALAKGKLTFVDNMVDRQTGTIALKATFQNTDRKLWPGQFVNIAMQLTTLSKAVTVPSQAVQNGQQGTYVYVIKPDKTAEARQVALGVLFGNQQVIKTGVNAGETVVTDGQMRIAPGTRVDAKTADAPQNPAQQQDKQTATTAEKR
jgi:membrane fusion protein, multidrug efflux system